MKKLLVTFSDEKEKKNFIEQSRKYYNKRDDWSYFESEEIRTPEENMKQAMTNRKATGMIIGTIVWVAALFLLFRWGFKAPKTVTETVIVTGNTYEVTINTTKLPAIGSLVYYYDATIAVQHWAKLNQIRVDSDGITRYNLCTQAIVSSDELCESRIDDKNNCDEVGCAQKCTHRYPIPYDQCFDTSIIWSTEQDLRDWICNK